MSSAAVLIGALRVKTWWQLLPFEGDVGTGVVLGAVLGVGLGVGTEMQK